MTRLQVFAVLISAMYAVGGLLWLGARWLRRRPRAYCFAEFVGKSAVGTAMGFTVAIVLVFVLRWIGVFPDAR